jgi:hypothetical protein
MNNLSIFQSSTINYELKDQETSLILIQNLEGVFAFYPSKKFQTNRN